MFVINFSPNAVIPYVEQGQLSGLGWELSSLRKGGWLQILHQPGLWPPANLCRLPLRCHLLRGPLFCPHCRGFPSFVVVAVSSLSLEGGILFMLSSNLLRCQAQCQVQV